MSMEQAQISKNICCDKFWHAASFSGINSCGKAEEAGLGRYDTKPSKPLL